jgi:hypothetical protein
VNERWVIGGLGAVAVVGSVVLAVLFAPPPPAPGSGARALGAVAPQGLTRPAPQRCLSGPEGSDLEGERAMVASAGLGPVQISQSMSGFVHHVLPCLGGESPADTLVLELTVACSGVVDEVEVLERGDWSSDVAACVAETLSYAPFPAHDLPDGETFQYPLKFTPPS